MTTEHDGGRLQEYERWMRSWGASDQTVKARIALAQNRHRAWGDDPVGFTRERIEDFLAGYSGRSQGWTRTTYFANLSDYCAWLAATNRITVDPMAGMKRPKPPRRRPRPLSEPEVARVLDAATGDVRAWVLLALLAGLRAHEIAKIRGEDVSPEGIYVEGKGGLAVTLPCHPEIWALAQGYPRRGHWFPGRVGDHILSRSISTRVGNLFSELGIDGSIHRVRHVYATRLLRAGVNIRQVQQLMRHASLDTTANYTAVDEDELRAAINLLSAS